MDLKREIMSSLSPSPSLLFHDIHPLYVTKPVVHKTNSGSNNNNKRRYISRLITEHPTIPGASIETVLEETPTVVSMSDSNSNSANSTSSTIRSSNRLRIVIQSGPDSSCNNDNNTRPTLHASFQLPADTVIPLHLQQRQQQQGGNDNYYEDYDDASVMNPIMTWAAFPEDMVKHNNSNRSSSSSMDNQHINDKKKNNIPHKLLCVLIHANAVAIYNVYPSSDASSSSGLWTSGEGWTVSLPFDCAAIYALGDGGLLLQRFPDALDEQHQPVLLPPALPLPFNNNSRAAAEDDDEGDAVVADDDFVLQPPNKISRRSKHPKSNSKSSSKSHAADITARKNPNASATAATSTTPRHHHQASSGTVSHITPLAATAVGAAASSAAAAAAAAALHLSTASFSLSSLSSVPSLFSLKHPMQDPAPVCQVSSSTTTTTLASSSSRRPPSQQQQGDQSQQQQQQHDFAVVPFTDAWTEILFLGTVHWVDPHAQYLINNDDQNTGGMVQHDQIIAVTYRGGRHAVWTIHDAPAPPPTLPLYQQTRLQWQQQQQQRQHNNNNNKDHHRGHHHPDVFQEDWDLFGIHEQESGVVGVVSNSNSHYPHNVDDVVSQALLVDTSTLTNVGAGGGGARMSTGPGGPTSRTEALAEALGVRRTPRKSLDASSGGVAVAAAPSGAYVHPLSTRSANHHHYHQNNSTMSHSFFSPAAAHGAAHMGGAGTGEAFLSEATGHGNSSFFHTGNMATTASSSSSGPFSSIHSDVAMTCLYVEPKSQPRAKKVFLASNAQASGTLSICLVIPQKKKSSGSGSRRKIMRQFSSSDLVENTNELQILSLCPSLPSTKEATTTYSSSKNSFLPRSGYTFSVKSLNSETVPCINAQPLKVQPVPACFLPHPKYRCHLSSSMSNVQTMATDILVLSRRVAVEEEESIDDQNAKVTNDLTLYRQGIPFLPCALAPLDIMATTAINDDCCTIVDIVDPLGDRVTFLQCDRSSRPSFPKVGEIKSTRGSLALVSLASDSTEMALSAVEASLYAATKMEEEGGSENRSKNELIVQVALRLRADCVRLAQAISMTNEGNLMTLSSSSPNSLGWSALETVFLTTLVHDLKGKFVQPRQQPVPVSPENDPWKLLLESQFHNSFDAMHSGSLYLGPLSTEDSTIRSNQDSSLRECYSLHGSLVKHLTQQSNSASSGIISRYMFDALHLLYEDLSLCARAAADGTGLLCLLVQICEVVVALDPANKAACLFLDYYVAEMGKAYMDYVIRVPTVARGSVMAVVYSNFDEPPCILDWVNDVLRGRSNGSYFSQVNLTEMNAACARTRSLCRIFSILFPRQGESSSSSSQRDLDVVAALLEEGFTDQSLIREELKTGIALPLLDVLYRCRQRDSLVDVPGWSADACLLVGRDDLCKNMTEVAVHSPPSVLEDHPQSKDMAESEHEETKTGAFSDEDNDGLLPLELKSSMWFPEDNRVHEAARLLRSSRPIFLRVPRAIEVSDHEFEQLKQKKLSVLVRRTLALPIGRGMMTMGSLRPVPAEPLPLPELCLKGRVPPTNATLTLEQNECLPDMRVWPEFHNGVAAGLRLPVKGEPGESGTKITRTWIVYNRPPRKNNQTETEENGNTVTPPPNIKSHSHGGLLLALGLRGHLGSLRMTDIYEYLTQGAVTTTVGVLLGMAASERGSCDTAVSKMICLHIPSLIPQHFSAIDVASSVQTAAVTGAGLLFQGSSHRMMTEFLLNEIGKRPESDMSAFDREAYTLSCGLALGMVNLCLREKSDTTDRAAGIADLRVEERLRRYINGGEANEDESRRLRESNDRFSLPSAGSGADEKCSIIHEGNQINTQMTSPGATLALGLMYMKTGNHTIASAVRIPNTHFLLEFVRPDFLGLRVVAKSLILWDEVQPTREWIEAQVPGVVQQAYYSMQAVARQAAAGRSPVKARRPADYDRRAVRQIYIYIVAGACFGIGLRFAGTGDKRAKEALFNRVVELHKLREGTDAVSLVSRPELPTLETCLGLAAISLAMVLAGTGDLDALRLFKALRWRHDMDISYGNHMIYGMAIGLLFLGGGTMTLGREPADIAALVTAFFPRFPMSSTDNQYHLQALRHLYALAVKRRELCAVDVDTGESVYVPVSVSAGLGSFPLRLNVPCLLLNSDSPWREATVVSDKFYPIKLKLEKNKGCTFFVKRRTSLGGDGNGTPFLGVHGGSSSHGALDALTDSPFLLAYAEYIIPTKKKLTSNFEGDVLLECIAEDTEESLPLYLALSNSIQSMAKAGGGSLASSNRHGGCCFPLWDLRLIRTYFEHRQQNEDYQEPSSSLSTSRHSLMNPELLAHLMQKAETVIADRVVDDPNNLVWAILLYGDDAEPEDVFMS